MWQIKQEDVQEFNIPYKMNVEGEPQKGAVVNVFVLRLRHEVPGSVAATERGDGYFVAFSNSCTHMGCMLLSEYGVKCSRLRFGPTEASHEHSVVCGPCPCHGTSFDLAKSGLVILGPATQHLPQLQLEIQGESVIGSQWRGAVDPQLENWPA